MVKEIIDGYISLCKSKHICPKRVYSDHWILIKAVTFESANLDLLGLRAIEETESKESAYEDLDDWDMKEKLIWI